MTYSLFLNVLLGSIMFRMLIYSPILCQDSIWRVWLVAHEIFVHPDRGVLLLELIELIAIDAKDTTIVSVERY